MDQLNQEFIQKEIAFYLISLRSFVEKYRIKDLLNRPLDHLAIKAQNSTHFEKLLEDLKVICSNISVSELDQRRLVTGKLIQPANFGQLGNCNVIELMEPRLAKQNQDLVGFDHIEIYHNFLLAVEARAKSHNIPYSMQSNLNHSAIVMVINERGQELKFTDKHLEEIVKLEVQLGAAMVIK